MSDYAEKLAKVTGAATEMDRLRSENARQRAALVEIAYHCFESSAKASIGKARGIARAVVWELTVQEAKGKDVTE